MSKINVGRVILGGIVAGIIIDIFESVLNGGFLAPQWSEIMRSIDRPELSTNGIIMYDIMGFALGIAAVWTYAAIRPRFGAGAKTAIYAALLIWVAGYLYADIDHMVMGVYPMNLTLVLIGVGLIEIVLATIAGAWLYKEG
jgi:hypothetical protein